MKNETPIFQIRIPAKIIFFGEWAVLRGHKAFGCAVGKYFETSVFEHDNPNALFIESPEFCFSWEKLSQQAPPFLEKTCFALRYLFKDPFILKGKKLSLTRCWDLAEGLGSSSALFLSLALLRRDYFYRWQQTIPHYVARPELLPPKNEERGTIADQCSALREKLLKFQNGGSGFDLALQCMGGFLSASFGEKNFFESHKLEVPPEVLLLHTGKKLKTESALKEKQSLPNFEKILADIGQSSETFLETRDWERAISEHHRSLMQLGVVPPFVLEVEEEWKSKDWIRCLKTTGAGGGDTLIVFVNPSHREELEVDLKSKGFWTEEAKLGVPGVLA